MGLQSPHVIDKCILALRLVQETHTVVVQMLHLVKQKTFGVYSVPKVVKVRWQRTESGQSWGVRS